MATTLLATKLVFIFKLLTGCVLVTFISKVQICIPNESTFWEDFLSTCSVNEILGLTAFVQRKNLRT